MVRVRWGGELPRQDKQTKFEEITAMKTLVALAAAAVAALSVGLAGTASAETSALDFGPRAGTESSVAPAGYYYYTQGWRGNCFYRYIYVTNGYRYAYRWTRNCY